MVLLTKEVALPSSMVLGCSADGSLTIKVVYFFSGFSDSAVDGALSDVRRERNIYTIFTSGFSFENKVCAFPIEDKFMFYMIGMVYCLWSK